MPTYVYETVPECCNEAPIQFEVRQSMSDPPLKWHPDSGVPVRRVISGGYGFISPSGASPSPPPGGG